MINKNRLKAHMTMHGDTMKDLASALGISRQCLHNKIAGVSEFKQNELFTLYERYRLDSAEILSIFFDNAA